jgi:hypothetical protein
MSKDFAPLSALLPGEFEERTSDVLWKVHWKRRQKGKKGREVYLLILVELQSSCEQAMILRVLGYIEASDLENVHDLTSFVETNMTNFIAQARQEGVALGLANAVLRLMTRKYVDVPDDARSRVLSADVEQLNLWIDRILTADSVDEVFAANGVSH